MVTISAAGTQAGKQCYYILHFSCVCIVYFEVEYRLIPTLIRLFEGTHREERPTGTKKSPVALCRLA